MTATYQSGVIGLFLVSLPASMLQKSTLDRGAEGGLGVGRQACSLAGWTLEMEQADRFASASVFCNDSLMLLPRAPLGKAAYLR